MLAKRLKMWTALQCFITCIDKILMGNFDNNLPHSPMFAPPNILCYMVLQENKQTYRASESSHRIVKLIGNQAAVQG